MGLKAVSLTRGVCPVCNKKIPRQSPGELQFLGTRCKACTKERCPVFLPENVDIKADSEFQFNPLLGISRIRFDFCGSKILFDGKIWTVESVADGSAEVTTTRNGGGIDRVAVRGLGQSELIRLYKTGGGSVDAPKIDYGAHVPSVAPLLDLPIATIKRTDGTRAIWLSIERDKIACYEILQAFCNMYVRRKFNLRENLSANGGFVGTGFDAINDLESQRVIGLKVRLHASDEREHDRAEQVIYDWAGIMRTLLRYRWDAFPMNSQENIWSQFCRMQDVLLNVMPPDELAATLSFARSNVIRHAGIKF
jgi:hypothetical protein